ncbi:ferredoxin-fold anticodon-binding domain-containing protein 1-like isoform X3 [Apostichopus japonicus]|uniref:ferredoxin-fold anticodon-binding domain-containing protein 1-like isoform X3 n=1 Tax=Stichopus japonicus TaxID=307972 RepID=UPI003AB2C383
MTKIMENILKQYDHLLLVGEGNFSFSHMLQQKLQRVTRMVTTCYEDQDLNLKKYGGTLQNVMDLERAGATVMYGVDATKLHQHLQLATKEFDCMIFQFPHIGGKGNIQKNRQLLKGFFMSASQLLTENGAVVVTLCNGQGGTPSDYPQRQWHNSWQIVSMATYGDLILIHTTPFDVSEWKLYKNTGYRSQDKSFITSGAVIHVFQRHDLSSSVEDQPEKITRIKELRESLYKGECENLLDSWGIEKRSVDFLPSEGLNNQTKIVNRPPDQSGVSSNSGEPHQTCTIEGAPSRTHTTCCDPCMANNQYVHTSILFLLDAPIHHCLHSCVRAMTKHSQFWTVVTLHRNCTISSVCYPLKHYLLVNLSRKHDSNDCAEQEMRKFADAISMSAEVNLLKVSSIDMSQNPDTNCTSGSQICMMQGHIRNEGFVVPISFSFWMFETCYVGAVCLEEIVINKYGIKDMRLLWSSDIRWWTRLCSLDNSLLPVVPFSLYAPSYVHDLSFWSNSEFDEETFFSLVRRIAGDDIKQIDLLETFHQKEEPSKESRCYRMVYQSCDKALTKDKAGSLQTRIRTAVEETLGVIPR